MIYLCRKNLTILDNSVVVKDSDFHYLINVRRAEREETVYFFSNSFLYETIFFKQGKKSAFFSILKSAKIESSLKTLTAVISFADISALEESIKNSVEAGADNIILTKTERSNTKKEVVESKIKRFETIIESASSQSRRRREINISILDLEKILEMSGTHIIFHPYKQTFIESIDFSKDKSFFIWIGPEGGFSEKEIALFEKSGTFFSSLKTPILRLENAVTAAVTFARNSMGYNFDLWQSE